MQECGKKCGIDNTEKELYYNFRVVPLPILAGANGPVRLPSALSGGVVKPLFLCIFQYLQEHAVHGLGGVGGVTGQGVGINAEFTMTPTRTTSWKLSTT